MYVITDVDNNIYYSDNWTSTIKILLDRLSHKCSMCKKDCKQLYSIETLECCVECVMHDVFSEDCEIELVNNGSILVVKFLDGMVFEYLEYFPSDINRSFKNHPCCRKIIWKKYLEFLIEDGIIIVEKATPIELL